MPLMTQATEALIATSLQSLTALDTSLIITGTTNPIANVNYLQGGTDPSPSTAGVIGQIFVNTNTNVAFICTNIVGLNYTWVPSGGTNPLVFKGTWNANTNTPTLMSGVGTGGDVYIVSVAGNTNLDGNTNWQVGDWAVFNGTAWYQINNQAIINIYNSDGTLTANRTITMNNFSILFNGGISSQFNVQAGAGIQLKNSSTGDILIENDGTGNIVLNSLTQVSTIKALAGTGQFLDSNGNLQIDFQNSQLIAAPYNVPSVDWASTLTLYDITPNPSLDWINRILYASDGSTSQLDYSSPTNGLIIKDIITAVGAMNLNASGSNNIVLGGATTNQIEFNASMGIDFNSQLMQNAAAFEDGSFKKQIDVANRKLYATDGTTVMVDFNTNLLLAAVAGSQITCQSKTQISTLADSSNSLGTSGQILSTTGTVTQWINSGSTSAPLAQLIWVAKNGNDITGNGSIENPYLTINHALTTITPSTTIRYIVDIAPGNYSDNISLPANVMLRGQDFVTTKLTGTIDINDSSWNNNNDNHSGFDNLHISGAFTGDFIPQFSFAGKLFFNAVEFSSTPTFTGFYATNQLNFLSTNFLNGFTISGIKTNVVGSSNQAGTITCNESSRATTTLNMMSSPNLGNLAATHTTDVDVFINLFSSPVSGTINLNGPGIFLNPTAECLPEPSSITLSNTPVLTFLPIYTDALYDRNLFISMDPLARALFDTAAVTALDYDLRILSDNSATNSIDFQQRILYDNSGSNAIIDYQNCHLSDSGNTLAQNFNLRQTFATDGSTITIDYSNLNALKILPTDTSYWKVLANSGLDKTLTIESLNAGAGAGNISITAKSNIMVNAAAQITIQNWNFSGSIHELLNAQLSPIITNTLSSGSDTTFTISSHNSGAGAGNLSFIADDNITLSAPITTINNWAVTSTAITNAAISLSLNNSANSLGDSLFSINATNSGGGSATLQLNSVNLLFGSSGSALGFFGSAANTRNTVTGSCTVNTTSVLNQVCAALGSLGLIINSTTP